MWFLLGSVAVLVLIMVAGRGRAGIDVRGGRTTEVHDRGPYDLGR